LYRIGHKVQPTRRSRNSALLAFALSTRASALSARASALSARASALSARASASSARASAAFSAPRSLVITLSARVCAEVDLLADPVRLGCILQTQQPHSLLCTQRSHVIMLNTGTKFRCNRGIDVVALGPCARPSDITPAACCLRELRAQWEQISRSFIEYVRKKALCGPLASS
jgi:hypothetical protein